MKKLQYKDQNNKNYKIIMIVFFVMIFILLLLMILLGVIKNKSKVEDATLVKNKTIKDIVLDYGNIYIKETENETPGYSENIYVELKTFPYDGDNSNEKYYNNFLEDIARTLYYKSYFIIDDKNDYVIEVICDNNHIKSIIINDIEDYFIYMDSQISMKNYVEIPNTEIQIDSPIIKELVNKHWSKDIYFGTRDSIFDKYYIYFDEGIKVRIIQNNVYNVVFEKNYLNSVVNGLLPITDLETVKAKLGKPSFEDTENNIIGYKNDYLYVFFSKDEISIYRNIEANIDDFYSLADKFLAKEIDFKEFMNQLTYMWPDYSDYEYNAKSIFLAYPLKGIEIKLNYDDISGILVYNNIKSNLPKVRNYLTNSNFIARLKLDSVFEAEKRRVHKDNDLLNQCNEYKATLSNDLKKKISESFEYEIFPKISSNKSISKMNFISRHKNLPNRELNDRIDDYLWASNFKFIYSKEGNGINLFDLRTGEIKRIVSGENEYKLIEFKDNVLKYDNDKQVTISY